MEEEKKLEKLEGDVPDGVVLAENSRESICCMCIVGQIEGHYLAGENQKSTKYEHVIPQLVAIDEDERIDGLLILLNTAGGDVEAGLAIAELISGMKKIHFYQTTNSLKRKLNSPNSFRLSDITSESEISVL